MFEFFKNPAFLWVAVIIIGVAAEAISYNLTAIWFAVGALFSLIVVTFGGGWLLQIFVFAVASALLLLLIRPFATNVLKPKGAKTNADRIIGEEGIVTEEINNTLATGAVKILGQTWTARSVDGVPIPAGSKVRVCEISGVKVMVLRV